MSDYLNQQTDTGELSETFLLLFNVLDAQHCALMRLFDLSKRIADLAQKLRLSRQGTATGPSRY